MSIRWCGTAARSAGVGFAVPMSMPRYTRAESTLTISASRARASCRAAAVLPAAVGPASATIPGSRRCGMAARVAEQGRAAGPAAANGCMQPRPAIGHSTMSRKRVFPERTLELRVFLVEDIQRMHGLLRDVFSSLGGFAVVGTTINETPRPLFGERTMGYGCKVRGTVFGSRLPENLDHGRGAECRGGQRGTSLNSAPAVRADWHTARTISSRTA